MMKRLFAGRFIRSIGYLLSVHLVALLFFFGLRVALFIATDYDFPKEISEDYALQSVAFLRGLWFDNVIACYILLLPLAVFWIAGCSATPPVGFTAPLRSSSSFSIRCVSSFPQPISLISPTSSSPSIPPYSTGSTTRHHGGNGIRRNVLLPSHRLGTDSHRGFCLHHPPAVAHVLPFKPERRAPGKQMESRRLYVCDRNRPYRLVLFRHPRTAGL